MCYFTMSCQFSTEISLSDFNLRILHSKMSKKHLVQSMVGSNVDSMLHSRMIFFSEFIRSRVCQRFEATLNVSLKDFFRFRFVSTGPDYPVFQEYFTNLDEGRFLETLELSEVSFCNTSCFD